MTPKTIIDIWEYSSKPSEEVRKLSILPDGCRDLISIHAPNEKPVWFVSNLLKHVHTPRAISHHTRLKGYRLNFDVTINTPKLLEHLSVEHEHSEDIIFEHAQQNSNLHEALATIADADNAFHSIDQYAKSCGISRRSFQRLLKEQTGHSALYWRQLARVRNAGRLTTQHDRLSEIAYDAGFSDQAHMNREFKQWFGVTPKEFAQSTVLHQQLNSPAFA